LRNNMISRTGKVVTAGAALLTMGLALQATTEKAAATDSGLGFYNATDIYPAGNFHFDYDTFGRGIRTDVGTSVGLEYGFGPDRDGLFGRTEAGFDYVTSGGGSPGDRITANIKTQLYNNDASRTRAVLGFGGLGKKSASDQITAVLLGSKGFTFGRIHAGVFKNFERDNSGIDNTGLQLAFDRPVGEKVIIGADWRSGPHGFAAPFVIYNLNDKAGFEIGLGRANRRSTSVRHQTYIAFDYNFDFKRDTPTATEPGQPATPPSP